MPISLLNATKYMAGHAFSSSSFSYGWTYDVFLSFRGQDTRHGFTGNLYKALHDSGIHTFIDDDKLDRGEEITPALVKAIEESRIAIVVLSNNYASSSFCLDELSNIFDSIKGKGRLVLPVFYDVDPSHVRHQIGTYGEALAKHEERFKANKDDMERLGKWKIVLRQAANLLGWHFKHGNEYEHEFIRKIVEEVSRKIERVALPIADYPVGLESQVLMINSLLDVASDIGVHMVGIHGVGGIGKTTLALAVYNSIADHFQGLCFLENVRENSNKHGLEHLQKIILSEMIGDEKIKLSSVKQGMSIIQHRLKQKKVLLLLDDVDKQEQLQAIIGRHDWFGPGSRILITTRDKHLLISHGVKRTYEVVGLNKEDAFELLSWKAFKTNKVDPSYVDVIKNVVTYASGIPLALEVIGPLLFGKSVEEWKLALDQYKRVPNKEIQKILKISFGALEECEQNLFLDIACCFKGYQLTMVQHILHAHHGDDMKYHIGVLIDRSLIKIRCNVVTLHDLIEHMGKEIVRQESPEDPGKRSRLWFHEDIIRVLKENEGTSKTQIIFLGFSDYEEEKVVHWDGKAFKKMKNLKTLIIRNVHFDEGPKHLPNSLRVLEWWRYPSQSLPFGFHPEKLTIFKLSNSCLTSLELLKMQKKFMNMRVLKFDCCEHITQIPDVSGLPNLEELSFEDCDNLINIHESVGSLDKLRILDAQGCSKLKSFPPIKLTSLQHLFLSYCSCLEGFPEILGKMENITKLILVHTPIKELPSSIQNLTCLEQLYLNECGMVKLPSSIDTLSELRQVSISGSPENDECEEIMSLLVSSNESLGPWHCNISDELFPTILTCLAKVRELDLSYHNFTFLPACITKCSSLRKLNLDNCYYLQEIRWIPPNLVTLSAKCCISLQYLDLTNLPDSTHLLRRLTLDHCKNLQEIRGILPNIEFLSALNCTSLTYSCTSMLLNQELHEEAGNMLLSLPGSRIPVWFEVCSTRQSISFWFRDMFPAISLCVVVGLEDDNPIPFDFHPKVNINGNTMNGQLEFDQEYLSMLELKADHIFIFDKKYIKFEDNVDEVVLENEWNHAEVSIDIYYSWKPIQLSIQIGLNVSKQKSSMEDIRFTDPCGIERDHDMDSNPMASTCISSCTSVKGCKLVSKKRKSGQ